jgi:hypothetical protein
MSTSSVWPISDLVNGEFILLEDIFSYAKSSFVS